MAPTITTSVRLEIPVDRDQLFEWFIPIELPRILPRYGPLPGVVRTSNQTAGWDTVGARRTVHLEDGSSASEQVTTCDYATGRFGYTVSGFTNPVRLLASEARGRWWFDERAPGLTDVRWDYTFQARSLVAALALAPVVHAGWHGFMRQSLGILGELAQAEA